jgi:serine/threonine protein kinase
VARTVGRYELLRVIGRGGMATVYLARQTDVDRHVALKELKVLTDTEPWLARRFLHDRRPDRGPGDGSHPAGTDTAPQASGPRVMASRT